MKAYGATGHILGDEDYRRKLLVGIKRSPDWHRDINRYLRGRARQQAKSALRKIQEEYPA